MGPNRFGRRFNKPASGPVQYWSLHPLTPWAEILRGHGIKTADDACELRQRVWAARLHISSVDTITYENAVDYGLEAHHLVGDDYGACQDFGERCLREASLPKAIRVPSAALPGTTNLVLFGPKVAIPYLLEPIGLDDAPAALAAENAQPPPELLPLVRHFDDEHQELDAWRRGRPFEFSEPVLGRK